MEVCLEMEQHCIISQYYYCH